MLLRQMKLLSVSKTLSLTSYLNSACNNRHQGDIAFQRLRGTVTYW